MRLPLFWLHDYVDPGLDAAALAERLDMTGTEVERVQTHGVSALDFFVVGRVLSAERHPDADRLTVCMVETGGGVVYLHRADDSSDNPPIDDVLAALP